eukprot:jgi/Botrbrau1/17038/Bobra.49_2s0094.1
MLPLVKLLLSFRIYCLRPTRICFVLNRLVKELAGRGHSVTVAGSDWDTDHVIKHQNVTLVSLPGHRPQIFDQIDDSLSGKVWERVWNMSNHVLSTCDRVLSNTSYIKQLKVRHCL